MKFTIDLSWIIPFFNSAFFAGFATILAGLIAYFIFLRQKHDEKLKAARIILVEITDCESLFDNIKSNGIVNLSNIRRLPFENSWSKYKHLFGKEFDNKELKLIDNFYQSCLLLNKELNEAYNLPNYWQEKARIIAEKHASFSEKSKSKEEYTTMKQKIKFFEEDDYWWQPYGPPKQIIERIKLVQYVTTTPTGERLKRIAKL